MSLVLSEDIDRAYAVWISICENYVYDPFKGFNDYVTYPVPVGNDFHRRIKWAVTPEAKRRIDMATGPHGTTIIKAWLLGYLNVNSRGIS